jgi:hypothetical protein
MPTMSAALPLALACALLTLAGCGRSAAERTPIPAPKITLTPDEEAVWAPLPPDRSEIPVLLYHGIGSPGDFENADDADYALTPENFARQMTELAHAGYQTIDLPTFVQFVQGKAVDLPPRPLLLTFDDGRADSWTGSDSILKKLGFSAVMLVDVGRVSDKNPEYLTWQELDTMEQSGRWNLQVHSGHGHVQIQYGPKPGDTGPYYAYKKEDESFEDWQHRAFSDITWGKHVLGSHVSGDDSLAFAPPYGNYGQDGTNDPQIPGTLLGWLEEHFAVIFTQDRSAFARPGASQPLGRIQLTSSMTGGDLHALLVGH